MLGIEERRDRHRDPRGRAGSPTPTGRRVERELEEVTWDEDAAEKGGYETFMLKEIHEQPDAVAETITDRLPGDRLASTSRELDISRGLPERLRRIVIVACGTSYHAGLVGRYAIEQWARVPVEMDIASEYRYRDPVVGPTTWSSASPSPARRPTRWRRCGSRGSAARRCWRSPTSWAARRPATPTPSSTPAPAWRSASRRRRPSPPRSAAMYLLGLWLAQSRGSPGPGSRSPS